MATASGYNAAYPDGGMAEWSCSGLQSRVRRFDSDSRLQNSKALTCQGFFFFYAAMVLQR